METFETVSKDIIRKVTTTEEIIDLRPLKEELVTLDQEIEGLKKQPDEVTVRNDEKFLKLDQANIRKEELSIFMNEIK